MMNEERLQAESDLRAVREIHRLEVALLRDQRDKAIDMLAESGKPLAALSMPQVLRNVDVIKELRQREINAIQRANEQEARAEMAEHDADTQEMRAEQAESALAHLKHDLFALCVLARREHYVCDDLYYSCPSSGAHPRGNDGTCDCGAAEHNTKVDAIANGLSPALQPAPLDAPDAPVNPAATIRGLK